MPRGLFAPQVSHCECRECREHGWLKMLTDFRHRVHRCFFQKLLIMTGDLQQVTVWPILNASWTFLFYKCRAYGRDVRYFGGRFWFVYLRKWLITLRDGLYWFIHRISSLRQLICQLAFLNVWISSLKYIHYLNRYIFFTSPSMFKHCL